MDSKDRSLIDIRRGDHNKLGFSVQICTVRFLGDFLENPIEVPESVIRYIAKQLNISDPLKIINQYSERPGTHNEHAGEIKKVYGYYELIESPKAFQFMRWIYTRTWLSYERPSVLFDLSATWLIDHKILLPGITTLSRLISRIRDRVSDRLWKLLSSLPNDEQKQQLETLLVVQLSTRQTLLEQLRKPPTIISGPSLVSAIGRVEKIQQMGVSDIDVSAIPPTRLKELSRFAASARAQAISRMATDRRIATTLSFTKSFESYAIDDALDVFDLLITELSNEASRLNKKDRYRTIKDLDQAARQLSEACKMILDDGYDPLELRNTILSKIPHTTLSSAVSTVDTITRPPGDSFQKELMEKYRSVRRFLPHFLNTMSFSGVTVSQPTLDALEFLKSIEGKVNPSMAKAPTTFFPRSWKKHVLPEKQIIDRKAYTLCAVETLQTALKRRDIFVNKSIRWGDPRIKLLQGQKWISLRPHICRVLGRNRDHEKEISLLTKQLDFEYKKTIDGFENNSLARFETVDGEPDLVLSHIEKLEEPESLIELRKKVSELIPKIDLPEAILEIQERTGFADEFIHIGQNESRVKDLPISICAVLLAEACNIGLEPVIQPNNSALTKDRLSWVRQNHIRAETITKANARLVEKQTVIPFAKILGGGEVASADGIRFVSPIKTIHSGSNRKYFNKHRGVTYYNFISDQDMGFHGIPVPGTLRDSIFILEGVLEHQTCLEIKEIFTDMAAYSDIVFGLFWLLGYRFCPRLTDLGNKRFWRIDPNADYGDFNHISRHKIKPQRISDN